MSTGSLRSVSWKEHFRAPDAQLLDELYCPALERAVHYDRCCAYFSSSVLAAASRGFGGLIDNILKRGSKLQKPAVRLLVNEQLDQEDLKALLATGDLDPLIRKLLKQFKTSKDAIEKRRLEMLAWMTASGWLEVKVGLMRRTGGVLHAKFGTVRDAYGNVLAFMGSGNETREGLLENYEELRIFRSWRERSDVEYYQNRFNELWDDLDENVMVIPLPDAVKNELIKLAPAEPPVKEPRMSVDTLKTAILWKFIQSAPYLPGGETACYATAPVDLWPHQRRVVEDTARAFPCGRLICDEVGMGKTIEAIIALKQLIAGRGVKRALLLVPAGLLKQWQDELREKGGLLVARWEDRHLYHPREGKRNVEAKEALDKVDLLIISREWARLEANRNLLLTSPPWDLVILDEAHAARREFALEGEFNSGNLLLKLLRELQLRRRTRGMLLLSATPMQTHPWEPWDLLSVLGVGGEWIVEFKDIRTYYDAISRLPREPLDGESAALVHRLVERDSEFPDFQDSSHRSLKNMLMFEPADKRSKLAEWLRKGSPLSRRMHRNTRDTLRKYHEVGLLDYAPPKRDVQDVVFDYETSVERECYSVIKTYIDERFRQLEGERSGKGFVMTIYRRRAASSPQALRKSMERRLEACDRIISKSWSSYLWEPDIEQLDIRDLSDADIDEKIDPALPATPEAAAAEKAQIKEILHRLDALGNTDSKFKRFREVLEEITADGRAALVFTEYYDTLEYLRDMLAPIYGASLGCFSGLGGEVWNGSSWAKVSKGEITEMLSMGKLRVLVCTDAASEGLNLQAASALINYDLPWNPSKVEQRIGRIDRIGQRQTILPIRNMFLNNSVDMRVYQVLRERCNLFVKFVGKMQPILALAREALRYEDESRLMSKLEETVASVEDPVVSNVFIEGEAEYSEHSTPVLTRSDIEEALKALENCDGNVFSKRVRSKNGVWKICGVKKSVEVSTQREVLEKFENVVPISAGSSVIDEICDQLQLPSKRTPLVIADFADGPFKATKIMWVKEDKAYPVTSFYELCKFIDEWDGSVPSEAILQRAYKNAKDECRKRVCEMKEEALRREENAIRAQVVAASQRLLRELGRTLRCLSSDDLRIALEKQIRSEREKRENSSVGRYQKAKALLERAAKFLGAELTWTKDDEDAINDYVKELREEEKQARIAGSEIDAALNDPRWLVIEEYRVV